MLGLRFFHLAFLIALLLVSIHPAAAQTNSVKIGCLYPLTGPGGLYGRDSAVAVELALEHLQATQNPGDPTFEVRIEDTRSKALRSVQIARRFIEQEQVDFLCGVVSSAVAGAVTEEAHKHKIFFIGTDHASPSLVTKGLHPYYFRVTNGTRQSMLAGATYIQEHYPSVTAPLKIAFIGPDYDYGYQMWDDLKFFLKDKEVPFEVVGEYWPKLFETDYTPYIQQLLNGEIDIVVNGHWGLDLVTFVKQATQLGLFEQVQFMNFDAGGNYEILAELGNDMPIGLVLSARHHVNWPDTEQNNKFVKDFFELAGRYPSYSAQGAYTGIIAIAKAVQQAGGTDDKLELQKAFEGLQLSLPEDPAGFSSYMDAKTHQLMQVQAIGKTRFNNQFPPATIQLEEWKIYYPPANWPLLPNAEGLN